ncbi:MAG: DUF2905 domain-containing protein [Firmicutes bacterium]|nr:DUF2905 domain-containing protein [Bacillota bacterium]
MGKMLLVVGVLIVLMGLIFIFLGRLGLGRLPGDIIVEKGNFVFYFPLVTCVVISIILSFLIRVFFRH